MKDPAVYVFFISHKTDASRILTLAGSFVRPGCVDAVSASRRVDGLEGSKAAMLDIGMIVIGVGFFVASILYVLACEKM
jgi:hypothetical protein